MKPLRTLGAILATSALAFGIPASLQAAEPANDASQTLGADTQLRERVRSALKADPELAGARIDVATHAGIVTLTGELASPAAVSRALSLVASVEGVAKVENGLETSAAVR